MRQKSGKSGVQRFGVPWRAAAALIVVIVPATPLRGLAQGARDGAVASIDGCATLHGTRLALDTLAFEIRSDVACAPVALELVTPPRVPLARLRAGDPGDWAAVSLRVVNRTPVTLRAPLYLYVDDNIGGTVGGRSIAEWRLRALVTLATNLEHLWNPDRGDLPPATGTNSQRLYLVPGASSPPTEIDSLSPGGASGTVTLHFSVGAYVETFRVSLGVRALRAAPLIPRRPPLVLPDSFLAPHRLVRADSVPGRFGRDLIKVRFRASVPLAVRQRFVDRIGARVAGGVSAAAGEGDYVLQVTDSPDGRGVFDAWHRLGMRGHGVVARRGVVLAPPDSQAVPREPVPHGPTDVDAWSVRGVMVTFVDDADSLEREATLRLVGARVRARSTGRWLDYVVLGDDSTDAGIELLARRLRYLPTVEATLAWTPGLDTTARPEPQFGFRPPPRDSGQAARDPAIRRFIARLSLPSVHAVRDVVFLPAHDLLFFNVIYGQAREVYAGVYGVRHGRRIGLLLRPLERPGQVGDTARSWPRFTLRQDDMMLADPRVLDTLEALEKPGPDGRWVSLYGYVVLPLLVEDSLVPVHALRRCVQRIYRNQVGGPGPRVAAAATRIGDVGTLTQLGFLSGTWPREGEALLAAREGLRRLAPTILADPRAPRATLFALAQSLTTHPPDSTLIPRLAAHPAVRRDAGILALLAEERPWVLRELMRLLPGGPDVRTAIGSLFGRRLGADREAVAALLSDPVLGRDPAILAAIANAPPWAFPAASAEAGRRLPDGEFRRGVYLPEPPPVP